MGDVESTSTAGQEWRGYRRGGTAGDPVDQYVVPVRDRIPSFYGRASTFVTPGRAGTTGQKILALHNATGSPVLVCVNRIVVDVLQTAAAGIAPTVFVPVIRIHRFTVVPTNGTALTKVKMNSALSSDAAVTAWGDASADGTGSGTTLTVTIPAGSCLHQKYTPRILVIGTSASSFYEPIDTAPFFEGEPDITLGALEGVVVFLDYTVAAGNPTTNRWIATIDWEEYTRP
jgi:hypothetical protein